MLPPSPDSAPRNLNLRSPTSSLPAALLPFPVLTNSLFARFLANSRLVFLDLFAHFPTPTFGQGSPLLLFLFQKVEVIWKNCPLSKYPKMHPPWTQSILPTLNPYCLPLKSDRFFSVTSPQTHSTLPLDLFLTTRGPLNSFRNLSGLDSYVIYTTLK